MPDKTTRERADLSPSESFTNLADEFERLGRLDAADPKHITDEVQRSLLRMLHLIESRCATVPEIQNAIARRDALGCVARFETADDGQIFIWLQVRTWLGRAYPGELPAGFEALDVERDRSELDDGDEIHLRQRRARAYASTCRLLARLTNAQGEQPATPTPNNPNEQADFAGWLCASELKYRHDISPSGLSRAARERKIRTRPAPKGWRTRDGKAPRRLYYEPDVKRHFGL